MNAIKTDIDKVTFAIISVLFYNQLENCASRLMCVDRHTGVGSDVRQRHVWAEWDQTSNMCVSYSQSSASTLMIDDCELAEALVCVVLRYLWVWGVRSAEWLLLTHSARKWNCNCVFLHVLHFAEFLLWDRGDLRSTCAFCCLYFAPLRTLKCPLSVSGCPDWLVVLDSSGTTCLFSSQCCDDAQSFCSVLSSGI